jgi:hypothetical protein
MGMDRTIRFPPHHTPSWSAIQAQLVRVGERGTLRMIDGLPAFPDEDLPPGWKEIRIGLSAGMVTLRAIPDGLTSVVWGNADAALQTAWDKLCWAAAVAGGGAIITLTGPQSPDEFAQSAGLIPV